MAEPRRPGLVPDLARIPGPLLFLAMALSATVVAWISFDLLNLAMANADFLLHYRWMALTDGGLLQAALLALRGLAALVAYLVFKGCETELIARWRGRSK